LNAPFAGNLALELSGRQSAALADSLIVFFIELTGLSRFKTPSGASPLQTAQIINNQEQLEVGSGGGITGLGDSVRPEMINRAAMKFN
jgi:hypothetical protein